MSYIITTLCFGQKYEPIRNHWANRITDKCKKQKGIIVYDKSNILNTEIPPTEYSWWDMVRLNKNISLCLQKNVPVVHIDIDIIVFQYP